MVFGPLIGAGVGAVAGVGVGDLVARLAVLQGFTRPTGPPVAHTSLVHKEDGARYLIACGCTQHAEEALKQLHYHDVCSNI